jgi:uncharacterized membrane protein
MNKSIFGLEENIAGALSYAGLFFTGIVALVMEKDNKTVRFHALQSTIWFLFLFLFNWVLSIFTGIPLLGFIFRIASNLVGIIGFVSWAYLIFTAYKSTVFKLPVIGDVVWAQINK